LTERFAFVPDRQGATNIARFMAKHGVSDWRQLVERANNNIGWYWDAVNEDLGITWFRTLVLVLVLVL